jgi:hypothetical protein
MGAETRHIQNSKTSRRNTRVFSSVTTTGATPMVAASVGLGESRATYFHARVIALQSDFSALHALNVQAGFRRAVDGDVTRATSGGGAGLPYSTSSGDFPGKAPSVDLVANPSTQTIDIVVTGKALTTIHWHMESLSIQNLS